MKVWTCNFGLYKWTLGSEEGKKRSSRKEILLFCECAIVNFLWGNVLVSQVPLQCGSHNHESLVLCYKSTVCCFPVLKRASSVSLLVRSGKNQQFSNKGI